MDKKDKVISRQSDKRRKILKNTAIATGAVAASKLVPSDWSKPVVDSVLLPAHAQTSEVVELGSIEGVWVIGDDAPGGTAGINNGLTLGSAGDLYDDGTDFTFAAQLNPPAAVEVTADIVNNGASFPGIDGDLDPTIASADSGVVNFGNFAPIGDNWGEDSTPGTVVVTFKAEGYEDAVITLSLS